MSEVHNGGPAHPDPGTSEHGAQHGISAREYYKARVVQALVERMGPSETLATIAAQATAIVACAGTIADEMVREAEAFYQR